MRRAAALPFVVALIGLMGALAVGGAHAARRHLADARGPNIALVLRGEAERAAVAALMAADSAMLAGLPVGATASEAPNGGILTVTRTWVTRLSPSTIWVVSESEHRHKPLSVLRLGVMVRLTATSGGPAVASVWYHLP